MATLTKSSKYQVAIPKEIRETLDRTPGQKVEVIPYENRLELILVKEPHRMKCLLEGIDTQVPREGDRV